MRSIKMKRVISALLLFAMLVGILPIGVTEQSYATGSTKSMTISFEELLDGHTRSKSVNIPSLKSITSMTSNTGTVTHNISGEKVTVNVKGGSPSKSLSNPTKLSQVATDLTMGSTDNFSATKAYSKDGYSGTLNKDGVAVVKSGIFTPQETKVVSDTRQTATGGNPSSLPTTLPYNSGGFTGTLTRNGAATVISGYEPSTGTVTTDLYDEYYRLNKEVGPASIPYNQDGYSGTLTRKGTTYMMHPTGLSIGVTVTQFSTQPNIIFDLADNQREVKALVEGAPNYLTGMKWLGWAWTGPEQGPGTYVEKGVTYRYRREAAVDLTVDGYCWISEYSGTVTRPDTRIWRQNYQTTAIKPAVDTRSWQQNYKGTVYKAGMDDYYAYTVTINYIDNSDPVLSITTGNEIKYLKDGNFILAGKVTDIDNGQTIQISATIGGKTKTQTLSSPITNGDWSLTWDVTEIPEGQHSNIAITVNDGEGGTGSALFTGSLVVDKTAPELTLTASTIVATNKDVVITVKATDDLSGIAEIELPGGVKSLIDTSFTVSINGDYDFKATDKAGNITNKSITVSNIDKVLPTITFNDYIKTPTNQNILVTATTSKGTLNKESHTFEENGNFEFIATDVAGNVTKEMVTIANIDKSAPVITIGDYNKAATNQNVTVTATANKGTLNKESHTFTANGSFEFIATDVAGNVTKETVTITNIDKTLPVITFNDYIKTPTNQDIVVTATANKGVLNKESHTFTENGSFEFIATDAVGNVKKETVTISNIDKVAPVITIEEYVMEPTNQNITVTVKASKGSLNKESHTFEANGSFEFVATDVAGNITRKTVTITNIDKTLPVITFNDYIKTPTNQDIVVTATANKGSLNKASHTFTENGSFEFIATDLSGNVTKETVTITNIDRVLPVITIEEFSIEPTNQNIIVTATTSKGTLNQESHTFTENDSFEFVAIDAAGNITKETVSVDNINKVLPVITVADYIKSPTNENITVTVSADKGTFNQDSYTFEKNESFEFVVTDIYGNIAKETVKITNIDKVAPVVTLTPSETNPTNKNVTITVEATDNLSGIAEIELHDKSVVKVDKAIFVAEENGVYSFKVTDKAGNVTSKEITVSNIDKVLPVITIGEYITEPTNQNIVVTAETTKGTLNKESHIFEENGSFEFIATDVSGNITKKTVTITNIDKITPVITIGEYTTEPTNQNITVTATTSKGTLNQESHTFTENGSFEFIVNDIAGNVTKKTVTITNIDKITPVITIGEYTTEPTNQNITVTATTSKGTLNKESHTFDKNDSFEFIATDEAGNVTKKMVTITNINKALPVITVADYTKSPTNQNITVTVTADKGTFNEDSFTFTENDSFEFIVTDIYGNVAKETVTITNIDKVNPTKATLKFSNDKVVLTEGTDADSGIDKHMYSIDNSSFKEWTTDLDATLFNDGVHNIVAKVIDKATNESELEELAITTNYREIEEALSTVTITLDRNDYNQAKDLVDNMENGDLKNDLLDELEDILNKVEEKEFEDLINGIDKEEDLKDIEDAINDSNLPEDIKNGLIVKINDKALELATKFVEKAESTLTQQDYDAAKEKVDKLVPSEGKTNLEQRLKNIIDKIREREYEELINNVENLEDLKDIEDEINSSDIEDSIKQNLIDKVNDKALEFATVFVVKAEQTITREDYNIAKGKVIDLAPSQGKTALEQRLKKVLDKIEEKEFADLIGGMENEEDVKKAGEIIKNSDLPEEVKEELLEQLNKKIRELTSWAVGIAEAVSREPYLGTAEAFIEMLDNSPQKDSYRVRMDAVYLRLGSNTELALKDADRVVTLAETNRREASVDNANKVVKALKNSPEKTAFEQRMTDLQEALRLEDNTPVEVKNTEAELKRATDAVALAETNKREASIDNAKNIVASLKQSEEKTALEQRLQDLKVALAEEVPVVESVNTEAQIKAAENSVATAEKMKREAFIKSARTVVGNLKDSAEKTAFIERLDAIGN